MHELPKFPPRPYKFDSDESNESIAELLEELLVEAEPQLDPAVSELFSTARPKCGDDLRPREADKAVRLHLPPPPPHYSFYHRTTSSSGRAQDRAHAKDNDPGYDEQSYMRLVFETVGRPLSQFKSTRELSKGLRGAIYGMLLCRVTWVLSY